MTFFRRLLTRPPLSSWSASSSTGVFLSEGIQKFLYPDDLGVGRFTKIGIPAPEIMAPFVGVCETVCGVLFLLGLLTRFAAITMIIDMLVAIRTKVPMLLKDGFWKMAHEAHNDWAMLLGSIFLLVVGAGGVVSRCDADTKGSTLKCPVASPR
jgi:putative oxidoreductase